ncbi:hypothetical protein KCU98_g4655, partial [Aureobasidium melanogenum]
MASRYMPPQINSSRNLALADATSTTCVERDLEPLSFSNIYVSIDTNGNADYNYNPHNTNPLGQSQCGRQTLHPTAAITHDTPTAPRVRPRLHTSIHDRSTGRYVRPMSPVRSNSVLEARQSSRGHIEHMRGVDPLISRAPRPCHLRPVRNISKLVSLTEIATRFGVEQDAIQTLNASAEKPGALKFIVLLENERNDNHGCYRQLIVVAKVNLHLLPGHELPYPDQDAGESDHEHNDHTKVFSDFDLTDLRSGTVPGASEIIDVASSSSVVLTPPSSAQSDTPPSLNNATEASDLQPIAIFFQVRPSRQSKAFKFLGWYELEETEFFAPKASALIKMLEQRSGKALRMDLESEWAKIRLVRQARSEDV